MKCERCGKAKVLLLTTWAECDCKGLRYPELAEGRFFWIDSKTHFSLPDGTWWRCVGKWMDGHVAAAHTAPFGETKQLYALPGKRPPYVPDNVPVLDRPPFGAWGDRFYYLELEAVSFLQVRDGYIDVNSGVSGFYPRNTELSLYLKLSSENACNRFTIAEDGHTTQELLDWLREMEKKV